MSRNGYRTVSAGSSVVRPLALETCGKGWIFVIQSLGPWLHADHLLFHAQIKRRLGCVFCLFDPNVFASLLTLATLFLLNAH
jgi:hypothetical protein